MIGEDVGESESSLPGRGPRMRGADQSGIEPMRMGKVMDGEGEGGQGMDGEGEGGQWSVWDVWRWTERWEAGLRMLWDTCCCNTGGTRAAATQPRPAPP